MADRTVCLYEVARLIPGDAKIKSLNINFRFCLIFIATK